MLRVRRVEFQFVVPNPLILRTRKTSGVRDPPRIQKRIRARTVTRLAINLFALLNVILFYCWIKRNGQSYVSTSGSRYFSGGCVSCYWREKLSLECKCRYYTYVYTRAHAQDARRKEKRTKYDVIKRQHYGLTGSGNYYIEVVNFWIIEPLFSSGYTRVVVRYARRQNIGLVDYLAGPKRALASPTYLPARAPRTL